MSICLAHTNQTFSELPSFSASRHRAKQRHCDQSIDCPLRPIPLLPSWTPLHWLPLLLVEMQALIHLRHAPLHWNPGISTAVSSTCPATSIPPTRSPSFIVRASSSRVPIVSSNTPVPTRDSQCICFSLSFPAANSQEFSSKFLGLHFVAKAF